MALGDTIRSRSLDRQSVRSGTFQLAPYAGASFVSLETLGVEVYGAAGLGLPAISPIDVAGVHQTTVISPRSIVLRCVGADALGSAAALLALLAPDRAGVSDVTTPAILRYVGSVRTLEIGVVLANDPGSDQAHGLVLRLRAADPYWLALADVTESLNTNDDTHFPYVIERSASGEWRGLGGEGVGPGWPVKCAVYGPDGKLYVGLSASPGVKVWDGSAWSTVGAGLPGSVISLGFGLDGRLWAAGAFAALIAVWNGSTWTNKTPPGSGAVRVMRLIGANPYVARTGDTNLRYYNVQTGSWWYQPSPGANVNDLVLGPDGYLYACGTFAGGVKRSEMGSSSWEAVGTLSGDVRSVWFAPDGLLYAGGPIDSAAYIWNGQSWRALNLSPTDEGVYFARFGDGVLIGGYFDGDTSGLLYWSGSDFYTLGINPGYSDAMAVASDGRVALGFSYADICNTGPPKVFTLQGTASALPVVTVEGINSSSTWLHLHEITNHATNTSLYMRSGLLVSNGRYVFDCDDRTVVDASGIDQLRLVVPGSRFPVLAPGENRISILLEVSGGGGAASLSYRPRYWSLESADRP